MRTAPVPCDLLWAVDLDRAWPVAAGQLTLPPPENRSGGVCYAQSDARPHYSVSLSQLDCATGGWLQSPVSEAVTRISVHRANEHEPRISVPGADDAFRWHIPGPVISLWVHKANCDMLIQADQDAASQQDLLEVAQRVAAGVVAGIKPS